MCPICGENKELFVLICGCETCQNCYDIMGQNCVSCQRAIKTVYIMPHYIRRLARFQRMHFQKEETNIYENIFV